MALLTPWLLVLALDAEIEKNLSIERLQDCLDSVALCTAGFALADSATRSEMVMPSSTRHCRSIPTWPGPGSTAAGSRLRSAKPISRSSAFNRARRLSPHDPQDFSIQSARAFCLFVAGHYEDALAAAEAASRDQPNYLIASVIAAICAAHLGRRDARTKAMQRVKHITPGYRITQPGLLQAMRSQDQLRWNEGLRIAGILE
jgi:hypothetical protein